MLTEISGEKSKLMTNSISGINIEIEVNGQKIETVTSLKYLHTAVSEEGSKPEIVSRIAQTTAGLTLYLALYCHRQNDFE